MMNIYFINGIYDILCALCILQTIQLPFFSSIHLSMFDKYITPNHIFERFLAYWIFTNGVIRVSGDNMLVAYSYYGEAAFFFNEYIHYSVYSEKALFVILSSMLLGHMAKEAVLE